MIKNKPHRTLLHLHENPLQYHQHLPSRLERKRHQTGDGSARPVSDVAGPVAGGEGDPECGRVDAEAHEVDEDRGGDLAGELEKRGFTGLMGFDAVLDELGSDVLGHLRVAGDPAREQPTSVAADVE